MYLYNILLLLLYIYTQNRGIVRHITILLYMQYTVIIIIIIIKRRY